MSLNKSGPKRRPGPRRLVSAVFSAVFLAGFFSAGEPSFSRGGRRFCGEEEVFQKPAVSFNPKKYVCFRAFGPLTIDGKLGEKSWEKAAWTDCFTDIAGPAAGKPRYRTRVKMLWDDDYFYIAAEMEEPHVWASVTERDAVIFYDNDFEVFIDPDGDTHLYYELEINALGTVWDLLIDRPYRDGGTALDFWDMLGLKTGCRVEGTLNDPRDRDRGWTVETALPWNVLKECAPGERAPRPGERWRVNFSRVEWKTKVRNGKYIKVTEPDTGRPLPEDNWVWSPQGLVNMHYPEMWGFVFFSAEHPGGAEHFSLPPEEEIKWLLRRVYYRQQEYFQKNGVYCGNVSSLGLDKRPEDKYRFLRLQATSNLFEASLPGPEGTGRWHIRQDGRVRRDIDSEKQGESGAKEGKGR